MDLACVEATRAVLYLGLDEHQRSAVLSSGQLEVCKFEYTDRSATINFTRDRVDEEICQGTPVDQLWHERFALLAKISRNVAIVDRYCLQPGDEAGGLERFLTELDGCSSGCCVTVHASVEPGQREGTLRDTLAAIKAGLTGGGISDLKLNLVASRDFVQQWHDRFVRFNKTTCDIGQGMSTFSGREVGRATEFHLKPFSRTKREIEENLVKRGSLYGL